jgi:hypothetical protein
MPSAWIRKATTPGRQIVRDKAKGLLSAMQKALKDAPQAAEIVACECVVDAETKDHGNWELIGAVAQKSAALKKALGQRRTSKSRTRKTSTCTTRRDGAVSCGSTRSGSLPSSRRRKK